MQYLNQCHTATSLIKPNLKVGNKMTIELTFEEVVQCVKTNGTDLTYMVQGAPGVGKTAVGKKVAADMGYPFAYIDMANMSLGDLSLPVANKDRKCAEYFPNEIFNLHSGVPVVIMLDEWTKAGKEAKNMTLPMCLERRLGNIQFHKDSIVFATGNLTTDGIGDSIQAHQRDRFVPIEQRGPTAEEWINNFAVSNGIAPSVIAFVDQFPQVMQSYKDDVNNENPYIFNPRKAQSGFSTPRSLTYASKVLHNKTAVSANALHASLAGAIGESAAADLLAFDSMSETLPPFASIVANPKKCVLPSEQINQLLLTYTLVMKSDKETIDAILTYMGRMSREFQGLFISKLLCIPSKVEWAASVKGVVDAASELHNIF